MKISAEKILENKNTIFEYISKYISSPRKEKLLKFYTKFEERLTMLPASHRENYHNCFEGGYFDHVLRVIEGALKLNTIWVKMGTKETYNIEELVFSALNHDLGKMGDEENISYIPQTDKWRKEKLGEKYKYNDKISFMTVPDRSLFLLQSNNISYTLNEMLAIKLHDGLYDEANKKYLISFIPEVRLRTSLPFIIHQADQMAARIEFEREWFEGFNKTLTKEKPAPIKNKALSSIKSENLQKILKNIK